MKHTCLSSYFDLVGLACESSLVIGLRMMTFAAGGADAAAEAQLMVAEKLQAAAWVTFTSAMAMAGGKSANNIGRSAIAHYRRKVVANRRRLLRSR